MSINRETFADLTRRVDQNSRDLSQLSQQVTALMAIIGAANKPRDPSIAGFCARHGISRMTYVRLRRAGNGPRETAAGTNRITITEEDERAWIAKRDAKASRAERTKGGALRHKAKEPAE